MHQLVIKEGSVLLMHGVTMKIIMVITTEKFRDFSQLVRANIRVLSQLMPQTVRGALFPYHLPFNIPSFVQFPAQLSLMPTLVLSAAALLHTPIQPLACPRAAL